MWGGKEVYIVMSKTLKLVVYEGGLFFLVPLARFSYGRYLGSLQRHQ